MESFVMKVIPYIDTRAKDAVPDASGLEKNNGTSHASTGHPCVVWQFSILSFKFMFLKDKVV